MDMEREILLNEIMAHDFMILDLRLFLDTHPTDKEALNSYNSLMTQSRKLRLDFENKYGPLSQASDIGSAESFTWVSDPWPWEKTYLTGEN